MYSIIIDVQNLIVDLIAIYLIVVFITLLVCIIRKKYPNLSKIRLSLIPIFFLNNLNIASRLYFYLSEFKKLYEQGNIDLFVFYKGVEYHNYIIISSVVIAFVIMIFYYTIVFIEKNKAL